MSSDPVFAADSMGKGFGEQTVLKAASIWATAGRITVVFGRNGSGKTTLLKVATGLVPADHGVVHFRGRSYTRPRLPSLARDGLFYLPDRGLLTRNWSVRFHLEAVAWRFRPTRFHDVIEQMGAAELLEQFPDELSSGERRRVELALAVLREPVCLLADEPFASITPTEAELVSQALRQMAGQGAAIVVTGHEVPALLDVADDVVWMVAGTTHGLGSVEEALAHEQFVREYLGPSRDLPARATRRDDGSRPALPLA